MHGITVWISNHDATQRPVHASTVGSIRGPDMLSTTAFIEQYHSIGWHQLFTGRLSHKWGAAVALYQ